MENEQSFDLKMHLTDAEVSEVVQEVLGQNPDSKKCGFISILASEAETQAAKTSHFESLKSQIVEALRNKILNVVADLDDSFFDFLGSEMADKQLEKMAKQSIGLVPAETNQRAERAFACKKVPEEAFPAEVLEVYPEYLIVSVDTGGKEPKTVIIPFDASIKTFSRNQPVWIGKKFFKQGAGEGQMQFERHPNFKIGKLYKKQPASRQS